MTGVLVIFSDDKSPWFRSDKAGTTEKKHKNVSLKTRASAKSSPDVVNKIFAGMVELTTDPFWKTTFYEASIGKFHRGFRFSADTLSHKVRNRATNCSISGMSTLDSMETVQAFMRSSAGIMSSTDIDHRNRHLRKLAAENVETSMKSWSEVRSMDYRNILVAKYVSQIAEKHGLTEKEEDQLESVVKIGIMLGNFNSDTIKIEKASIGKIRGLYRTREGIFKIDTKIAPPQNMAVRQKTDCPAESKREGEYPISDVDVLKKWLKMLRDIDRKNGTHKVPEKTMSNCSQSFENISIQSVPDDIKTSLPSPRTGESNGSEPPFMSSLTV